MPDAHPSDKFTWRPEDVVVHPPEPEYELRLGVAQRPLRRARRGAILGGVCAGLAIRLGVRERTVRVLFSLSILLYGAGLLLYVATWLFLRRAGEHESIGARLSENRRSLLVAVWASIVVVVVLLTTSSIALQGTGGFVWTVGLSAIGLLFVWRGAAGDERTHLEAILEASPLVGGAKARGLRAVLLRVVPGVVLVIVALNMLSNLGGPFGGAVSALVGAMVLLAGLLILLAPWWLENVRDLTRERRERVRMEERSALIAHVHDSVLQTLTLIERAAGNETDVVRLARAQERELRRWLFDPDAFSRPDHSAETLTSMLGAIQHDVERDYGVPVELVSVGDCPVDEDVVALVSAAREACVNAAKWSGAPSVAVYSEVEPATVSVFVRDTGHGFDLDAVAPDRQGIKLSIRDRVAQHGGTATIKTSAAGTEVALALARRAT
ncbi:MAG: PspC domain-containing protein [Acidobacteriota bacterium]|nr:PspC domain-containing protein [Acidobacteriota bacterium]